MTEKHESQCWNCGSLDMEDKGSYVQCRACDATWNEIPRPGFNPLAEHGFYLKDNEGTKLGRMQRPSKSVSRAAAKARLQK